MMGLSSHAQDSNNHGLLVLGKWNTRTCCAFTNIFSTFLLKITGIYFHQYLILVYLPRGKLLFVWFCQQNIVNLSSMEQVLIQENESLQPRFSITELEALSTGMLSNQKLSSHRYTLWRLHLPR
jgi:hypothetical protein